MIVDERNLQLPEQQDGRELRAYVAEVERNQSNIVWEDAHKNAARVDGLLWKGSEDAPMVQRVGIAIFALFFMLIGLGVINLGREQGILLCYVIGGWSILLAAWLIRNALRGIWKKRS
ncbi:hypothetical protein [Silvibacterium dinghuense]|uniref:Uncharacterized protein n=1 Tax=Silvibacterium dinghuense TaxID=1560006 RepID=A0A4Q1S9L2_9BACT|nr:hypothetical protein [Silvibacterium dinghuense]RXS93730.1 hypothetical protein ESZ00_16910 [Silvibacterium dinghuense]GGH07179.1 hypothetical protein GCM10011586_24300 [Silvibacterium dinghuense]